MVPLIASDELSSTAQDWTTSLCAMVNADIAPLGNFDEGDPLGFAFYTLVLLRTRVVTRASEKLPDAARQWAEAKLVTGKLSPYRDRELGALGLLVYAFSEHGVPLENEDGLGKLALHESSGQGLLFDSFFLTSLIALGLAKTADGCPPQFVTPIEDAVASDLERLRNDPKALLAGFWFTRAIERTDLSEQLFRAADDIFLSGADQLDGRLCSAAILLEKMEEMAMRQRLKVAAFAHDCIKSVGVEAAAGDGARDMLLVEEDDHFPAESPHVSRILVSVGLLCRDTLERKSSLLLTKAARAAQLVRASVYTPFCVVLAIGVLWVAGRIRPPHPVIGEMLVAPSFSTAAIALGLLLAYAALAGVFAFALLALHQLVVGLAILGKRKDEFAAFGEAWRSLKKHYKIELCIALLVGALFDLLIRRG
jgi:hypothetical protein